MFSFPEQVPFPGSGALLLLSEFARHNLDDGLVAEEQIVCVRELAFLLELFELLLQLVNGNNLLDLGENLLKLISQD